MFTDKLKKVIKRRQATRKRIRENYSPENALFEIAPPTQDKSKPQHDDFLVVVRGGLAFFFLCLIFRLVVCLV